MNIAIILSGGSGSRLKSGTQPKQYLTVSGKPIFSYCLSTFQKTQTIDAIVIVAGEEWHDLIHVWLDTENISKFRGFANPGRTRQHSIYEGLKLVKEFANESDVVIIHDAARPLVSTELISKCVEEAGTVGGAMPVLPMKDTVYMSDNGSSVTGLLNRDEIFAGQAPEAFQFGRYLLIHENMTDEEIAAVRGSSEIAYRNGIEIKLVEGSELNFKITTRQDLQQFEAYMLNGEM